MTILDFFKNSNTELRKKNNIELEKLLNEPSKQESILHFIEQIKKEFKNLKKEFKYFPSEFVLEKLNEIEDELEKVKALEKSSQLDSGVIPTTMEEYEEGAKNLERIKKLHPSPSLAFNNLYEGIRGYGTPSVGIEENQSDNRLNPYHSPLRDLADKFQNSVEMDKKIEWKDQCYPSTKNEPIKTFDLLGVTIPRMENTIESMGNALDKLLLRVEKLESLLNIGTNNVSIGSSAHPTVSKGINNTYMGPKIYTTTSAILEVLKNSKKELHLKDIFNKINKYTLKNQNVTYQTVKSTVYGLVKKKKIRHGLNYGCFEILKSSKDI